MLESNIFKMSELADISTDDVPTINILLCCLLYKLNMPVNTENFYEIVMCSGCITYFSYQESIDYMLKNELVVKESDCFVLTPKGSECALKLNEYAPKAYWDKLCMSSANFFAGNRNSDGGKVEYVQDGSGVRVNMSFSDGSRTLMQLNLYAPDLETAEKMGRRMLNSPAGFYSTVAGYALSDPNADSQKLI